MRDKRKKHTKEGEEDRTEVQREASNTGQYASSSAKGGISRSLPFKPATRPQHQKQELGFLSTISRYVRKAGRYMVASVGVCLSVRLFHPSVNTITQEQYITITNLDTNIKIML